MPCGLPGLVLHHTPTHAHAVILVQAKALSLPGVGLMSEAALAELLGVSDCRLVMDGVAW